MNGLALFILVVIGCALLWLSWEFGYCSGQSDTAQSGRFTDSMTARRIEDRTVHAYGERVRVIPAGADEAADGPYDQEADAVNDAFSAQLDAVCSAQTVVVAPDMTITAAGTYGQSAPPSRRRLEG